MNNVFADITTSLDGYVAGPNPTLEDPLGEGGEQLHDWIVKNEAWRAAHGLEGGERNTDSDHFERMLERQGAIVMGRRMFSGGEGPWEDDPNANGWWGDNPPFHKPVFVLTHHPRETVEMKGGTSFTFVTDGIESALAQARDAAGDKDVAVVGGANAIQQFLEKGLLDELEIHVVPLLLGGGTRLFDGGVTAELVPEHVIESAEVTHLKFQVKKAR
jgi:dihydrofolate reductase